MGASTGSSTLSLIDTNKRPRQVLDDHFLAACKTRGMMPKGRDMLAMREKTLSGTPRHHVIVPCRGRDFCIRISLNVPRLNDPAVHHREPQPILSGVRMKPSKISSNVSRVPHPVMRMTWTRDISGAMRPIEKHGL
jgi:hypothetical protein